MKRALLLILDGDGRIEIVATTTQTSGGAQVFVFNPDGTPYQPPGLGFTAWPRYNTATGRGNYLRDGRASTTRPRKPSFSPILLLLQE